MLGRYLWWILTVCASGLVWAETPYIGEPEDFGAPNWAIDLELSNRALFRSQIIDDDQIAFRLGATRFLPKQWMLSAQMHTSRGSGAVGWESQLALAKSNRFMGFDISSRAEYIRWHNSQYEPMALLGLAIRNEAFRLLLKQDLIDGGGQHLELNLRLFRKNKTTVVLGLVDTVLPQEYQTQVISTPILIDPEVPVDPTEVLVVAKSSQELQYAVVQVSYLAPRQTQFFVQVFSPFGETTLGSNWLAGVRWQWML